MSDFTSNGWAIFIALVTILGLVGVLWFLTAQSSRRVSKNAQGKVEDTGHVWDGTLRELNNPMPRWWLGMFYMGIIFGVGYLGIYGLSTFKGFLNYSSIKEYEEDRTKAEAAAKPIYATYMQQDIQHIAVDSHAKEMGQRLFLTHCAQCHGSDAGGAKGFPNLSDSDWLYGGDPETIRTTITKGRNGMMPALGEAVGGEEKVRDVAHYVRSLSGLTADAARVTRGKTTFTTICAACHGVQGKGNPMLGAPNLTDGVWLYGSSEKTIMETVMKGRVNQMPAHEEKLSPEKIHLLAAYVWGLSNHSSK